MQQYVIINPIVKNDINAVLLVRKKRPEFLAGRLNLLGGKLEPDEDPISCARREFMEESGIDLPIKKFKIMGEILGEGPRNDFVWCVNAHLGEKLEINPREGEDEEVFWASWRKVWQDPTLIDNLRAIVPMMKMGVKNFVIADGMDLDAFVVKKW